MTTILCIEDEDALRSDIVEELEDAGYDTLQAPNGGEGLGAIQKHKPDLVLCDIKMPEMNGFELLTELRDKHPKFADIPFIFLTAYADRKWVLAGLDRGADDYLTKPVDFELLLSKIKATLRRVSRMREEKEREHVKLYKALVKDKPTDASVPPNAPADGPKLDVVLVGRAHDSLDGMRRKLEAQGHTVTSVHSGKTFVDQVESLAPDLSFIWFDTDDIRGDMAAKRAREQMTGKTMPLVLVWSPELADTPAPQATESYLDDFIQLPLEDGVLRSKIRQWVQIAAVTAA